jgi:hypothetical protein
MALCSLTAAKSHKLFVLAKFVYFSEIYILFHGQ